MLAARRNPEVRAKITASNKATWASEELRALMSEQQSELQTQIWKRRAVRKKHRAAGEVLGKSLDFKLKISKAVKLALNTPEAKAKMSQRATAAWARRKAATE